MMDDPPFAEEMDRLYKLDLDGAPMDRIIECKYDLIIVNHVLEHLFNAERVYDCLCGMLKPNGVLYAEYPSIETAKGFRHCSSYHFHSDPTHKRILTLERLANIALDRGCTIEACGSAGPVIKQVISPFRATYHALRMDWDGASSALLTLFGKISYIAVRRAR